MTKSKDLVPQSPTHRALARRYGDSIAVSAKDIKPGQAILITQRGKPIARKTFKRLVAAIRVGYYAAVLGGSALFVAGFPVVGAALYFGAMTWLLRTRYRSGGGKFMAIELLIREGKLDEAQRSLEQAPGLERRSAVRYWYLLGSMASHRGDYAGALEWWNRALPHAKGLGRDFLRLGMTKALLLSGRHSEARALFAHVKLPPEADEVLAGQNLAHVMFFLCDPQAPRMSDDELHDRTRRALEYSHTGAELAAFGWAFERTGDQEMAELLANEARDRMHYPYLATWWPALQQWLDGKTASPPDTDE